MTVVTFVEYQPMARFDALPWTMVHIQEAAEVDGPWTTIETITFLDPDVNPADPKVRSFTTEEGTLENGWYQLIFEDADGDQSPTDPIHNVPDLAEGYLPLVSDIGALLRARTKDSMGQELGTFTSNTRPTYDEVQRLILQAAGDVTSLTDYDIPVEVYRQASGVIALRAAMLVELSYFPEQVATGRSAYNQYKEMYDDMLARLMIAVEREAAEEVTGELPAQGNVPVFGFPVVEGLLYKRM